MFAWNQLKTKRPQFLRRHPVLAPLGIFFLLSLAISLINPQFQKPKIGVVRIEGVIMDSEETQNTLRNYGHDDSVKGVILRINSPGGAVAPSQEIYREVIRLSRTKKVYASLGTVAASGGYYVASASSKIFALPGSITGSIGVIMQAMNLEGLAAKLGLRMETIKAGKNKDLGNAFRPMRPEERSLLESMLKETHRQFLADVQARRSLDPKLLAKIGDGRVLTGSQAKKFGLVDEIAGFKEVEDQLAHDLGLDDWELYEPKDPRKEFFKSLESLSPFKKLDSQTGLYYLFHWLN